MKDNFGFKGHVTIEKVSANGKRELIEVSNTTMNVGKSQVTSLMTGDVAGGTAFDYMAIGTGSDTIIATDTALGTESYREAATGTQQTSGTTNDTMRLIGSFTADGTKVINEAGIFNAASTGSMFARTCFADQSMGSEDNLNITWDSTIN